MSGRLAKAGARAIHATMLVDRAYALFDRARSRMIAAWAGNAVLDAYNDLAYGTSEVYDAGAASFRSELFNWETELVGRVLPPPPGKVLVGGAGGGREAFALAARGYEVVAFEPATSLARSMAERARHESAALVACTGRYEDLPILVRVDDGARVDVRDAGWFAAAVLGWTSYSHLRSRAARVATLARFSEVTRGPIVLSFYLRRAPRGSRGPSRLSRLADAIGMRAPGDRFTPHIGFFHLSAAEELEAEIAEAGLRIGAASWDDSDGRWPWVAAVRPQDTVPGA